MAYKILIVDDEPEIFSVIQDDQPGDNMEFIYASNGSEGWEKINNDDISLVITDLKMPVMDGVQLLDLAKTYRPELPVIIISGHLSKPMNELYDLGACAVFNKPFEHDQLLEKVRLNLEYDFKRFSKAQALSSDKKIKCDSLTSMISSNKLALGRGGAYLDGPYDFKPGDSVNLVFEDKPEAQISAQVVWNRHSGLDGQNPGLGIEFTGINSVGLELLETNFDNSVAKFIPFKIK